MPEQRLVVLCTVPDRAVGEAIAGALVHEGLAACVNILPQVTSVYRWQGEVATDTELLMIIKTRRGVYQKLEQRVTQLHPYELPEVIAVPISEGLSGYLSWIDTMTGGAE